MLALKIEAQNKNSTKVPSKEKSNNVPKARSDCWNFIVGSRCTNESFWMIFGYKLCNDQCIQRGMMGGRCVNAPKKCFGMYRRVKVCRCY